MSSDQQRQWAVDHEKAQRAAQEAAVNTNFPFQVRITVVPKWQNVISDAPWKVRQGPEISESILYFPRQESAEAFLRSMLVVTNEQKAVKFGRMVLVASNVGAEVYEASFDWKADNEYGYGQRRD